MKFITPNWPAPTNVRAFTTLRTGWGGRKPSHDLNKGNYASHDANSIAESQSLREMLNLPDDPIWITQTHSTTVIEAKPENREKVADASFTGNANQVCVVMTADCLPILICNQQGTKVAAIHAGWRGLAGGIIEAAINALKEEDNHLIVWLGPAIGPNKFEVGQDVFDAFTSVDMDSTSAFTSVGNKWLANLYELAKLRLRKQNIQQIYGGGFCTYTQDNLFFSYRRDKGRTGRMASLIWIEPI